MIALPADVLATDASGGWEGQSMDSNTGNINPNKVTAMSWAEHQRIVCNSGGLLAGDIVILPDEVKKVFDNLKSAFTVTGSKFVVRVSKGIHQPTTNPHMQLYLQGTFKEKGLTYLKAGGKKFHLNLSAIDTAEKTDSFQWKGVQFSYMHDGMSYNWPVNAVITMKRPTIGRRNSVSAVDLQAFIKKGEEEKRAAEANAVQEKFDAAWKALAAKYKPSNAATKNFYKGDTVMHLKCNRPFHIKYDPVAGVINKTNPTGTVIEVA